MTEPNWQKSVQNVELLRGKRKEQNSEHNIAKSQYPYNENIKELLHLSNLKKN